MPVGGSNKNLTLCQTILNRELYFARQEHPAGSEHIVDVMLGVHMPIGIKTAEAALCPTYPFFTSSRGRNHLWNDYLAGGQGGLDIPYDKRFR